VPLSKTALHLRDGDPPGTLPRRPAHRGGDPGAAEDQHRTGAGAGRLGRRLLPRPLREGSPEKPDRRRVLRPLAVEQRALPPLVLPGETGGGREADPGNAVPDREGSAQGEPGKQPDRLQGQLERDPGVPDPDDPPGGAGALLPVPGGRPDLPPDLHGGDPQLPERGRPLPRGGDRHRGADPGRPGDGTRGAGRRRHRRLLRREPADPRLPPPLGGRYVRLPGQPRVAPGDRDRGLQRRLRLREQVRRAGDPGFHPVVRDAASRRGAEGVDQADHVHRRDRADGRPARGQGAAGAGDARHEDRRARLPDRDGRRGCLQHDPGGECRGPRFQRRPAGRRRDGAEGEPGPARLRRDGGREPDRQHPRPGGRRELQRRQGDRLPGGRPDRGPEDPERGRHPLRARAVGGRVPGAERAADPARKRPALHGGLPQGEGPLRLHREDHRGRADRAARRERREHAGRPRPGEGPGRHAAEEVPARPDPSRPCAASASAGARGWRT